MNKILLSVSVFFLTILCAFAQNNTTDEGVLIDGITWATRNVDVPGTFAENPEDVGMFYQWNRKVGWSSTDPMVNSDGGTTWDSSTPEGTEWEEENNPCPENWRVPTRTELISLNGSDNIWTTQNDTNGRLFGTAPNQIFLPATDIRRNDNGAFMGVSGTGRYWSSTFDANSLFGASAWGLNLSTNVLNNVGSSGIALGFVIRCVKENTSSTPNISADSNRTIIAFYNILGQKLPQAPQSGIYIVAFDNGSTEKRIR